MPDVGPSLRLSIMHNNRAYHQERMYVTDMAARANRDVSRADTDRILPDQQLNDIDAFLRSLPAARPAKEIPLLSQPKDGK
jgi:hypothetical protein